MDHRLTVRPQYGRLNGCTSDTVVRDPRRCALSCTVHSIHIWLLNFKLCHIQKYFLDTVKVGCVRDGQAGDHFVKWCASTHLQLNTSKTKEMVVDFHTVGINYNLNLCPYKGLMWRWSGPSDIWGCSWMISLTVPRTWIFSSGSDRAIYTSLGCLNSSTSAKSCFTSFTNLWSPVSFTML